MAYFYTLYFSGHCTVLSPRKLDCLYFGDTAICDAFCSETAHLSPKHWMCVSYDCQDADLVPCNSTKTCLAPNVACGGACPPGAAACPSTNVCHSLTQSETCDNDTCLLGQTLVQAEDDTRYCAVSATLSDTGRTCTGVDLIYCEELDICSDLDTEYLCQACPEDLVSCPDSGACVSDTVYCCGIDGYYCEILEQCLAGDGVCQLPNVPPIVSSDLVYIGTIDYHSATSDPSDNGQMVGLLLGNGTGSSEVGVDSQDEEISIAIIGTSDMPTAEGAWQYATCLEAFPVCTTCSSISSWTDVGLVSETAALYLPNTACLRFWRKATTLDGSVWLRARLWDGNSDGYHSNSTTLVREGKPHITSTLPYKETGAVSQNYTLLTSLLLPVTDPPRLIPDSVVFPTIDEDVSLIDNLGRSVYDLVNLVHTDYLPILNDTAIQGFPSSPLGVSYEELLPADVAELYYERLEETNIVRGARLSVQPSQSPGIGIGLGSHDDGMGSWQVSFDGDTQLYVDLEDILPSPNQLLLLNVSSYLRWLPQANYFGEVELEFRAWDGVLPPSLTMADFFGHKATIIDRTDISAFDIGIEHYARIAVTNIPDAPVIISSTAMLSPLPYTLTYDYTEVFSIIITQSASNVRTDVEHMEDILHLILEEPVAIHRVYPATDEW